MDADEDFRAEARRVMRLFCYGCEKSVSSEVPAETVVRACLFCPECMEKAESELAAMLKKLKPSHEPQKLSR